MNTNPQVTAIPERDRTTSVEVLRAHSEKCPYAGGPQTFVVAQTEVPRLHVSAPCSGTYMTTQPSRAGGASRGSPSAWRPPRQSARQDTTAPGRGPGNDWKDGQNAIRPKRLQLSHVRTPIPGTTCRFVCFDDGRLVF